MTGIQEIKNDIMLLKNIGSISKEVELVLLRKLTSLEYQIKELSKNNDSGQLLEVAKYVYWNYDESSNKKPEDYLKDFISQ